VETAAQLKFDGVQVSLGANQWMANCRLTMLWFSSSI
jgi:hypothetical protein